MFLTQSQQHLHAVYYLLSWGYDRANRKYIFSIHGQCYSVITVKTSALWWKGFWCWLVRCLAHDASPFLAPCHGYSISFATNTSPSLPPSQHKLQTIHHLSCAKWATVNSGKSFTTTHVYATNCRFVKRKQFTFVFNHVSYKNVIQAIPRVTRIWCAGFYTQHCSRTRPRFKSRTVLWNYYEMFTLFDFPREMVRPSAVISRGRLYLPISFQSGNCGR